MDKTYFLPMVLVCLLLGGVAGALVGYTVAPEGETRVVTEEIVKEVPVEKEVVVNNTIEKPVSDTSLLLDKAVQTFVDEELEDLEYCGGDEYDVDQVQVNDIEDDYTIQVGEDTEQVDFEVELKYLDADVDEKCYSDLDVSVLYEEDEDPEVTIA